MADFYAYLFENDLVNENNIFYYNINDLEMLNENNERVLMHYKVYDNRIECKNKKEFIISNKQNIKITFWFR